MSDFAFMTQQKSYRHFEQQKSRPRFWGFRNEFGMTEIAGGIFLRKNY